MASNNDDKLICGRTARKYLNCSKAEFEILVKQVTGTCFTRTFIRRYIK